MPLLVSNVPDLPENSFQEPIAINPTNSVAAPVLANFWRCFCLTVTVFNLVLVLARGILFGIFSLDLEGWGFELWRWGFEIDGFPWHTDDLAIDSDKNHVFCW